jgi:deoxycytidylate deaminase
MYCTTFPCHNCAKHIVAAGISRVVFVEPYPKSRALELHDDAIILKHENESASGNHKVEFEPFVGLGPQRFLDLFSMHLGSGKKLIRKENGSSVVWKRESAEMRVPLLPASYIEREMDAVDMLIS